MVDIVLMGYRIKQIDMKNSMTADSGICLKNGFEFKMIFSKDGQSGTAELTEMVNDGDDRYYLKLCIEGMFRFSGIDGNDTKKEAHMGCYDVLFPYANQIVSQISLNSGLPGVELQKMPLNIEDVYFQKEDSIMV